MANPFYVEAAQRRKVVVFGGGSYATALAYKAAMNGHHVTILTRNAESAKAINETHKNPKYLANANYLFPENVRAETDAATALKDAEFIVHTVPVQASREYLSNLAPLIRKDVIIISASKGLCTETLEYMSQIIPNALKNPDQPMAFFSGPSFAKELVENMPTLVVVASAEEKVNDEVQHLFSHPRLRVYKSDDIIGVEVGGALKNVFAIGAGIVEGMGMGLNTTAGLVTRGASELTRLALAMGAQAPTLAGLSGMGDLMLTCFGNLSRNRSVGIRLGKGETLEQIKATMAEVAEGVATTPAAAKLALNLGLDLPLIQAMNNILSGKMNAREALVHVMNLPIGSETHASIIDYYINKIRLHHSLPSNLSIVAAKPSDIPAFIRIIGHTFVEYDWIWNPRMEVPDLINFEKRYCNPSAAFWVLKDSDETVGGIGVDIPTKGMAELHRLYLLARVRGQKLGLKLTLTAVEWAKGKGCDKVIAWSDTRFLNAHKLYRDAGFKQTGKRQLENDPNDTWEYSFELTLMSSKDFTESLLDI